MSSSITFRIRHATGFRSDANASHPSRNASSGIEPPPANGSTTSGASSPCAACTRLRPTNKQVGRMRRHVPVGERAYEPQQCLPQFCVVRRRLSVLHSGSPAPAVFERLRNSCRIARLWQTRKRGAALHGSTPAAGAPTTGAASGRMFTPLADGLLPRRVLRHDNAMGKSSFGESVCTDLGIIG